MTASGYAARQNPRDGEWPVRADHVFRLAGGPLRPSGADHVRLDQRCAGGKPVAPGSPRAADVWRQGRGPVGQGGDAMMWEVAKVAYAAFVVVGIMVVVGGARD